MTVRDRELARKLARTAYPQYRWCERCASGNRVARHHPDYARPLDVQFLCVSCHRKVHPGTRGPRVLTGLYLKQLWYWRERRAMTQAELAVKTGITAAALSRLENCTAQPRPSTTRKLADALEVELGVLMGPPDR